MKYNEKMLSLYTFPVYIFFSILIGASLGALLDKLIVFLQNDNTSRVSSLLFLFIQLIFMSFFIYVFIFNNNQKLLKLENFSTGSFFFNLAFFTLQPSIPRNLQTLLNVKTD